MTIEHQHVEGCLFCAVRQMTEGEPPNWNWYERGATITGVVLRKGSVPHPFFLPPPNNTAPFLDLWLPDNTRSRVLAIPRHLQRLIEMAQIQVGDTVTVVFLGKEPMPTKFRARTYAHFSLDVKRGHH